MSLTICGKEVGPGSPCLVIAEAGVNHNGVLHTALRLIDAAAEAGADAVKFQTFDATRLVTENAPKAEYQKKQTGTRESHFEMLRRLQLDGDSHVQMIDHCRRRNIQFLSSPFDERSADLLNELGVSAFKIPSGEVTNLPLLKHIASFGKPIIMSTGMCRLGEVENALETLEATGNRQLVLLHCVSNYPADPADVNLRAMQTLSASFHFPVGYSDHTMGNEVSWAAVAMGACIIEKHFTLDRHLPGPDHAASSEPAELGQLVRGIRTIESALGTGRKRPAICEESTAAVARKSLVAAVDLEPGMLLGEETIAIKRPGTGLPPIMKPHLLNRLVRRKVAAGSLLTLEDVA